MPRRLAQTPYNFVHSDFFRHSSFVLRDSVHGPSLRIEIRDVSTSLDMTSVVLIGVHSCPFVVRT